MFSYVTSYSKKYAKFSHVEIIIWFKIMEYLRIEVSRYHPHFNSKVKETFLANSEVPITSTFSS